MSLCLPKSLGGMGFRNLGTFNQALLAKQGWRLLCNPDSIVHQVLNARYFKNGGFISANRGYDPSYVWRSIWGAKALLLDGLKWRVGDGMDISVWDDAWLPGENVSRVPTPNIESPADHKVAKLIDEINGGWCNEALSQHLPVEDAAAAHSLPLSVRAVKDVRFWVLLMGFIPQNLAIGLGVWGTFEGGNHNLEGLAMQYGRCFWSVNGPPKLCNFLWTNYPWQHLRDCISDIFVTKGGVGCVIVMRKALFMLFSHARM